MEDQKKKPKFLRRKAHAYSKLGKGRKKKQIWRRPTGRDNKMREKRKGYPATVSIGYGSEKTTRGMLKEKTPITINNINDLKKVGKENIVVIGAVGKKKKLEIAKEAKKMNFQVYNMNPEKFIEKNKKNEKKDAKKEEKKTESKEDKK